MKLTGSSSLALLAAVAMAAVGPAAAQDGILEDRSIRLAIVIACVFCALGMCFFCYCFWYKKHGMAMHQRELSQAYAIGVATTVSQMGYPPIAVFDPKSQTTQLLVPEEVYATGPVTGFGQPMQQLVQHAPRTTLAAPAASTPGGPMKAGKGVVNFNTTYASVPMEDDDDGRYIVGASNRNAAGAAGSGSGSGTGAGAGTGIAGMPTMDAPTPAAAPEPLFQRVDSSRSGNATPNSTNTRTPKATASVSPKNNNTAPEPEDAVPEPEPATTRFVSRGHIEARADAPMAPGGVITSPRPDVAQADVAQTTVQDEIVPVSASVAT